MNTQIALPKIEVTPKPTKAQIIEALVEREREIWKEKREEVEAKIKPLRARLRSECFFEMSRSDESLFEVSEHHWSNDKHHASVSIDLHTPKIKKILMKIMEIDRSVPSYFPEDSIKYRIKEAMKAPPKSNPLLNNPEAKQALDSILKQIKGAPAAIEAKDVEIVTEK